MPMSLPNTSLTPIEIHMPTRLLPLFLTCIITLAAGCKPAHYGMAPDFSLQNNSGQNVSLHSFNATIGPDNQEGDYLLLNFWASWCVPCIREMPLLQEVSDTDDNQLLIIGIAADRIDNAKAFADNLELDYPLLYGEPLTVFELMEGYGNPQGNLPYTVLVDREGTIIWRHAGQLTEQLLASLPIL